MLPELKREGLNQQMDQVLNFCIIIITLSFLLNNFY